MTWTISHNAIKPTTIFFLNIFKIVFHVFRRIPMNPLWVDFVLAGFELCAAIWWWRRWCITRYTETITLRTIIINIIVLNPFDTHSSCVTFMPFCFSFSFLFVDRWMRVRSGLSLNRLSLQISVDRIRTQHYYVMMEFVKCVELELSKEAHTQTQSTWLDAGEKNCSRTKRHKLESAQLLYAIHSTHL